MVKWSNTWLNKKDNNGTLIRLWASKKDETYASCNVCSCELKFSTLGFHALLQHSTKPKHKAKADVRFSSLMQHFTAQRSTSSTSNQRASSSSTATTGTRTLVLDLSLNDKVTAAETTWLFKVAECDLSLRDADQTPEMFKRMFPDSAIANSFTMSRQKASYNIQDGIGPLLKENIVKDVSDSSACFTLMFDETTTLQEQKQMDLLLRYWSETENKVITKYFLSLFFGRAKATDIVAMFQQLQETEQLPWRKLCNISTDGPNINRAIWRLFNDDLREQGFNGLLPFLPCTLHIIHNGFRKIFDVLGEDVTTLVFDLHAWFKNHPCKKEDFINLSNDTALENEAVFLRHVITRWLTLSTTLKRILERWPLAKKYFLDWLPQQAEYKQTLKVNGRYKRIAKCFQENEQVNSLF